MPASGLPGLIVSTAAAVGSVLGALVVLWLTRWLVRYAAEPDRSRRSAMARPRAPRRDR